MSATAKPLEFRHRVIEEDQGFTHVPNAVLLNATIPAMVRLCYTIIKSYAYGQKCDSFPSQKTLAEQLGVKERSVRYYLEELEILGLITTEQRGLGKTNVYWIEPLTGLDERVKKYLQWKAERQQPRQSVANQEWQYIAGQERQPASGPGGNPLPTNNTKKKNTTEERNTLAPIAQSLPQPPPVRPDQAITELNTSLKKTAETQSSQQEEPERKVPPKESPPIPVKPDDWFVVAGDIAHGPYPSYEAAKRGADEHQGTVTQGQVVGGKTVQPVPKIAKPKQEPKPWSALTKAMWDAIPESIRPSGNPYYAKENQHAESLHNAGFTAARVTEYVTWAYVNDKWICCGGDGGAPIVITMSYINKKIKAWQTTKGVNGNGPANQTAAASGGTANGSKAAPGTVAQTVGGYGSQAAPGEGGARGATGSEPARRPPAPHPRQLSDLFGPQSNHAERPGGSSPLRQGVPVPGVPGSAAGTGEGEG